MGAEVVEASRPPGMTSHPRWLRIRRLHWGTVLPMLQRMKWIAFCTVLAFGVVGTVGSSWALLSSPEEDAQARPIAMVVEGNHAQADPRVRAFVDAYGPLIDSVTYGDDDVVFALGSRPIHFQDGRMLGEGRLDLVRDCDPIFYDYSLDPLTEPPPLSTEGSPVYCTDVLESLWGRTEAQIRLHGRSTTFLDHRMFLNDFVIDALATVEGDILEAAADDVSVATWIDELSITYSFIDRGIAGSSPRSHHSWGMALDLVPNSYGGRHVYWRWSRVLVGEGWHRIPLERRWSPPVAVIEIFERHGFVWGGKWSHFDDVHFEYRPEILLYNRLIS